MPWPPRAMSSERLPVEMPSIGAAVLDAQGHDGPFAELLLDLGHGVLQAGWASSTAVAPRPGVLVGCEFFLAMCVLIPCVGRENDPCSIPMNSISRPVAGRKIAACDPRRARRPPGLPRRLPGDNREGCAAHQMRRLILSTAVRFGQRAGNKPCPRRRRPLNSSSELTALAPPSDHVPLPCFLHLQNTSSSVARPAA